MSQIVLFRFIAPDEVEWLLEGAAPEQGTLEELATRTAGRQLFLAAPGEAVILTRAKVPGRQRATLLRAIPYALEDSLAEDVDTLHFALGNAAAGTDVPVAVIRHKNLSGWLEACAQAGITPGAVIPDPLLLPYEEGSWSILVEEGRAVVRSGPWEGFATEWENLGLLLEMALSEAGEAARPHYLRAWGSELPDVANLPLEVRREAEPHEPLQVLAAGLGGGIPLNLLQGPYSRKAHLGKWLRPWRVAAVLIGLWLGIQAAQQVIEYWQLSREQAYLRTEMERVYKEAVPTATRIVNPRVQLEGRLQELRQGAGDTGAVFLDLLYQGGQTLMDFDGVTLRGLRYNNERLDLDLEGGSLETLDQLRQRLSEQSGLEAEMRTTKREGKIESQVVLRKAPS